jgi:FkbM family methyltransferase
MKTFKLRGLDFVNKLLGPFQVSLIPKIWRWRTWSVQRKDVLEQLRITKAFDVGACTGQWVDEFRKDGFDCPVISFECDPRALKVLEMQTTLQKNWSLQPFALSDRAEESTFNLWPLESGQSSLKAASESGLYFETINMEEIGQIKVKTKRFDEIVAAESLDGFRCLLKIDVQGAEMGVLRGMGDLLEKFVAIEIELALCDFYEGNDMVEDVLKYLRTKGFDPFTIQTERWGGNNNTLAGGLDCDVLLVNRKLIGEIK